jgi:hypothetical protein
MLDVQEKPELAFEEPKASVAEKRAAIESELRENAQRSDRAIADILKTEKSLKVDHKTVGAARARLGMATPLGANSPPISPWKPTPPAKEPEFDPFEPGSEDLVIPHQPAIAVYENTAGAVVIRQATDDSYERDPIIQVRPEHVERLIARLRQVAKEAVA